MDDSWPQKRRGLRFSLRGMLVAVAISGFALGFVLRASSLENRALFHDRQMREAGNQLYFRAPLDAPNRQTDAGRTQLMAGYDAVQAWHEAMALRYRRAIWRPWLQFTSEPSPPPDPEPHLPRARQPRAD